MERPKLTVNLKGLEDFKTLLEDSYRARVGILGSATAQRKILKEHGHIGKTRTVEGELDNATLGMIQMFGSVTKNIPPRDFLLMPIETHGKDIVKRLDTAAVREAIDAGDVKKVFALLGAAGEDYVQQAFETSGFGQWPPNKAATIARKGSDRPLIDTAQLRRAITSDVVKASEAK